MDEGQRLRVFVCGGRDFRDGGQLATILDAIDERTGIERVIETGDRAGKFAADWAVAHGVRIVTLHGDRMSSAGRARLAERIVTTGQPDLAIGFSGGVTTAALLEQLERAGVRVRSIASAHQDA